MMTDIRCLVPYLILFGVIFVSSVSHSSNFPHDNQEEELLLTFKKALEERLHKFSMATYSTTKFLRFGGVALAKLFDRREHNRRASKVIQISLLVNDT